jgi:hypothetical protein
MNKRHTAGLDRPPSDDWWQGTDGLWHPPESLPRSSEKLERVAKGMGIALLVVTVLAFLLILAMPMLVWWGA